MIVLLLGARAGTKSETGIPWTQKEVEYAFLKNKRVFTYLRETPRELLPLVDRDKKGQKALASLLESVQKRLTRIQRFRLGECCKLTAMVIRDVDCYAEVLKTKEEENSYNESFG